MKTKRLVDLQITTALLCILALSSNVALAAPRLAFERTWGGPNIDRAQGIAIAPDGSLYVGGLTGSFGTGAADGDWDVFLLKYDSAGTLLWQRTWGRDQLSGSRQALDDDYALDIALGPDGSVHLGGVYSANGGPLVLKLDPAGNVIWATNWEHPTAFGHAQSITVAGDGSVYIAGGINGAGAGNSDMLIIKFASDGALLWQQTWGGPINEIARDIAAAADGSVYVAGEANSFFANDAVLIKYAPDGTIIWQRDWHEGTIQDLTSGEAVAVGSDGSVYLAGFAGITGVGQHIFLVKFTSDGTVVWESTSGGAAESGLAVAVGPNGNIYVTGSTLVVDTSDTLVTEFLPEGKIRSSVTWGGPGNDYGDAIAVGADGAVYVAGVAQSPPYDFGRGSKRTRKPNAVLVAPDGTVTNPGGTTAAATGTLLIPNGSETYAGDDDAALLKILF
jgi:uncharacterized delta-60 repeat protein